MRQLFRALEELHPGYVVEDVHLMLNPNVVMSVQEIETLDGELANAVRHAKDVDMTKFA